MQKVNSVAGENYTISALVCTRNRGISIVPTVRSILACTHPQFTLIVIDQSENEETKEALKPFLSDTRLRYLPSKTQGLGKARNLGLAQADTDLVAMTDDDCEVPPEWLTKIAEAFQQQPKVAVLFCNVMEAPGEWPGGYIPAYKRNGDALITCLRDRCKPTAIGASMAVRRTLIRELGGFDEMLGAGAPFPAHEEDDLVLRALLEGHQVLETDRTFVYHYGFRTVDEGRVLALRNYTGTGGGLAKFLKCRQWGILRIIGYIWWATILTPLFESLLHFQKPRVLNRIVGFCRGFLRGLRTPVDRQHLLFRLE